LGDGGDDGLKVGIPAWLLSRDVMYYAVVDFALCTPIVALRMLPCSFNGVENRFFYIVFTQRSLEHYKLAQAHLVGARVKHVLSTFRQGLSGV